MNRAQLYLWSVLHSCEHRGVVSLFDLDNQAMRGRFFSDTQERQAGMEGAIGLWAERFELSDVEGYLRNLRADNRTERLRA